MLSRKKNDCCSKSIYFLSPMTVMFDYGAKSLDKWS